MSVYDDNFLDDEQRKKIAAFTEEWNKAYAAGDRAGMDAAHAAAERVRAQAGYSGGENGGSYTALSEQNKQNSYQAAGLKTYTPQIDAVNNVYDAAREAHLAALKTAYDENNATLEAEKAEIPIIFQTQKNAVAGQSELAGRNFREYAAAAGLNSGTGGQAELARSNQLQGNLSALGQQEAVEQRKLESELAKLKIQYQNDIATAIAEGEYDRAAALLEEYRRAEESTVSTSQAQADENYRAWSAGYQQSRDTVSDAQWRESFDSQQEQNVLAEQLTEYQKRLQMAELQAEYGDFSGLKALGVDTSAYEAKYAAAQRASVSGGTGGGNTSGQEAPVLTWPQVQAQIEIGNLTPNVLSAYRYYMGQDYAAPSTGDDAAAGKTGSGLAGSVADNSKRNALAAFGQTGGGTASADRPTYDDVLTEAYNIMFRTRSSGAVRAYLNQFSEDQLSDEDMMRIMETLGVTLN